MHTILAQMLTESYVKEIARTVVQDHNTIQQQTQVINQQTNLLREIATSSAVIQILFGLLLVAIALMVWRLDRRLTRQELIGPSLSDRISREARLHQSAEPR